MGYSVNGPIVRDSSLVFAIDGAYDKSYDPRENLVAYSTYNAAAWSSVSGNATLTTGIDAPDGSNTAVRFAGTNGGNALFRVSHPSITPSGSDSYVVSFYARLISGSTASSGIASDWGDLSPSGDYTSQLSTNNWVRIVLGPSTSTAVARTFVDLVSDTTTNYVIDFWGLQIEKATAVTNYTSTSGSIVQRGTSIATPYSAIANNTMTGNVFYTSSNGGGWNFVGNTTSTSYISVPAGHANYSNGITIQVAGSMNFTGGSYMRFIDFGNGPGSNNIIMYRYSTNQQLGVDVYGTPTYASVISPVGTLTTNENAVWCFTMDGATLTLYKNGTSIASVSTTSFPVNVTRNNCYIGRSNWANDPYLRGNIYDVKIYNRALTPSEVAQNAAAIRGRFNV